MTETLQLVCPHCAGLNRVPAARLGQGPKCGHCHQALFQGHPVALDEAGFRRQVQHSQLPLLVDFWAAWCGPCRAMAPEFEAAAKMLEPQMRLAKLDTEAAPAVAQELRITGIPTLALFAGGREVGRQSGAMPARRIVEWARAALNP